MLCKLPRKIVLDRSISSLTVGSVIKTVIGTAQEDFIVVHQGLPSSDYDASCDGTWLLMKDLYVEMEWGANDNNYRVSLVRNYLEDAFLNLVNKPFRDTILQVILPYWSNMGNTGSYKKGADGLSSKVFLLSDSEVGFPSGYISMRGTLPGVGAKLDYFESGTGDSANSKRIANFNGRPHDWWNRSPFIDNDRDVCSVGFDGMIYNPDYQLSNRYVRPALILDKTAKCADNGDGTYSLV